MKYTEMNINKIIIGDENYLIYNYEESEDKINMYLKSQKHEGICPS